MVVLAFLVAVLLAGQVPCESWVSILSAVLESFYLFYGLVDQTRRASKHGRKDVLVIIRPVCTKWSLLSSADTNRERCKHGLTSFLLLATVRNEPTKLRPALPHWASLTLSHSQVDQCQSSPAASPEILHHTVWRTWLFIAYSDERWLHLPITPHTLCISL